MRLERRNLVLGVLVLGCLALDYASRPSAPEARVVLPIFPQLQAGEPARIEISNPDVDEPLVLELVSGPALERAPDAAWRLPAREGWPVRAGLARNLLRGIENLETLDLLASDVASHADYGVTLERAVRVRILDGQGTLLADLLQGGLAPGGRASYLRAFAADEVWRVPRLGQRISAKAGSWMEPRWMPISRSRLQVEAITLSGTAVGESVRLLRSEGSLDAWLNPKGEIVSPAEVRLLLEGLEALFVSEVLEDGVASVGDPRLSIQLEGMAEGQPWIGHFGARSEDGRVLATRGSLDWVVGFPSASVEALVETALSLAGK